MTGSYFAIVSGDAIADTVVDIFFQDSRSGERFVVPEPLCVYRHRRFARRPLLKHVHTRLGTWLLLRNVHASLPE